MCCLFLASADIRWPQWHSMSDSLCHRPRSVLQDDAGRRTSSGIPEAVPHLLYIHPSTARSSEQDEWKWCYFFGLPHRYSEGDQDEDQQVCSFFS